MSFACRTLASNHVHGPRYLLRFGNRTGLAVLVDGDKHLFD